MDKVEFINHLFNLCIFPLLAILTAYVIQIIKVKMNELAKRQENETIAKYINMLSESIAKCVEAVNQTYVDALKKKGEFGLEAQKVAFNKVYTEVIKLLGKEAYEYLDAFYEDFDNYLKILIEAQVRTAKLEVPEVVG